MRRGVIGFHEAQGIVVPTSPTSMRNNMAFDGVGWIAAIVIGGLAGWLAGMMMKSNTGIVMNIILGVVGAIVASLLLGVLGVSFGGWLGYLIAGFIGACILIAVGRALSSRRV